MKKKKNRIALFILIVFVSIGYALLTSSFNFGGITNVLGNTWGLHLENVQVLEGSVTGTTPTIESNRTTVNFTTTLTKPGDFYSFTVDAVNDGTIAAEVESIEKNELDEHASKYIRYEVLNDDDSEVEQGQEISANSSTTFKVIVEYREDILATDLYAENQALTFEFTINFTQANLRGDYNKSVFARLIRKDAYSDKHLDVAVATTGRGIYVVDSTQKDRYPIYYYRGAVTNNNAKFAGFCWKIVRTTETGGTKLVYNGLPDENGHCTATDTDAQIGATIFNENHKLPYDGGYMYGDDHRAGSWSGNTWYHVYGKSVTYNKDTNTYQLVDTCNAYACLITLQYRYTCVNSSTSCSEIKYSYVVDRSYIKYIILTKGEVISDAIENMKVNKYDSLAKQTIDSWFEENMIPYFENLGETYNSYIEDTVWCNDREFTNWGSSGWNPIVAGNGAVFGAYSRGSTPTVKCSTKNNSFTVSDNRKGNGALTYPVGMLTQDELVLAGVGSGYLGNSGNWWTMTPRSLNTSSEYMEMYTINGNSACNTEIGIRPSISIRPEVLVKEGTDGTATNPYEFLVQ